MQNNLQPTQEQLFDLIDAAIHNAFRKFLPEFLQKPEPQNQSEVLNVKQAAEFLDLALSTVYGLVHKSELPHFKKGHKLRFKRSELLEWIESGQKKTSNQIQSKYGITTTKPSKQ